MARFKNNDLLMRENQKIIFGNSDAYMYWNGVEMVFYGITISGAQGPPGPPGAGLDGNQITDVDGTTYVRTDDTEFIDFYTNSSLAARITDVGELIIGQNTFFPNGGIELAKHNDKAQIFSTTYDTSTQSNCGEFVILRGRGTYDAGLKLESGDVIGRYLFSGVYKTDGSTTNLAWIRAVVDSATSEGAVPTAMEFYTTPNSSANAVKAMSLGPTGKMYLNSGVGVDFISNDANLADGGTDTLVTQTAVKSYVDAEIAKVTTVSGILSTITSGETEVDTLTGAITFKVLGEDVGSFGTNGEFYLANGVGVNNISVDSSFYYADNNTLMTAKAIKDYIIATVSGTGEGGFGGSYSYLTTDDGISKFTITNSSLKYNIGAEEIFSIVKDMPVTGDYIYPTLKTPYTAFVGGLLPSFMTPVEVGADNVGSLNLLRKNNKWGNKLVVYSYLDSEDNLYPEQLGSAAITLVRGRGQADGDPNDPTECPKAVRHGDRLGTIEFGCNTSYTCYTNPNDVGEFYDDIRVKTTGFPEAISTYYNNSAVQYQVTAKITADIDGNYSYWSGSTNYGSTDNNLDGQPDWYDIVNNVGGTSPEHGFWPTGLSFWVTSANERVTNASLGLIRAMYITPTAYVKLSHPDSAEVNYFVPSFTGSTWSTDKMVPTLRWVEQKIDEQIGLISSQEHSFMSIHSDVSAYNASLTTAYCSSQNFEVFHYEDKVGTEDSSVLSGFRHRTADSGTAAALYTGMEIYSKTNYRTNLYISNWSSHYDSSRQGPFVTFWRSHGFHPSVRLPLQYGDVMGGISCTGVGASNLLNSSPCATYTDNYFDSARIFFRCEGAADKKHPASIHFQTGARRSSNLNIAQACDDLNDRMIIWDDGDIDVGTNVLPPGSSRDFSAVATTETTDYFIGKFNIKYGDLNCTDPSAMRCVLNIEGGYTEGGTGTSIGFSGQSPNTSPSNIMLAKIVGGRDSDNSLINGGRLSFFIHPTDGVKMSEVIRINRQSRISIGHPDVGQGFDTTYGKVQINQITEDADSGLAVVSPDGTSRGAIWAWGETLRIDNRATTKHIVLAGNGGKVVFGAGAPRGECDAVVQTIGNIAPWTDNLYDLGTSSFRWDDVYATNTTIQLSDKRDKKDIDKISIGLDFINKLKPKSFTFKDGTRKHYGLIAQEVENTIKKLGIKHEDFAPLVIGEDGKYGLRYGEFIAPMMKAIQELTAENKKLVDRMARLERKFQ